MKTLALTFGSIVLFFLLLPAFVKPPATDHTLEDQLIVDGAKLLEALAAYHHELGEYPPGGPAEIARALRGENAQKKVFYECAAEALDARGELLDPFGTPYRIEYEGEGGSPRISSAGRNRFFEASHARHSDDYHSWHHQN